MHSNNRFSVCEGNKLKKWKNSGLERWFWYYKRREEPYCRMQWLQMARICLVPVSSHRTLCLCCVTLSEAVQGALRGLGLPSTLLLAPASVHSWFPPSSASLCCALLVPRKDLTARVVATSVIFHLCEKFNSVYASSLICKDFIHWNLVSKLLLFWKQNKP